MIKISQFLILAFISISAFSNAQNLEDKTLLTIDGNTYDAGTFLRVYLKNLDIVQDNSQKDIDNYLQLYIDYRLKLMEAREMGLQNGEAYKQELQSYRNSLAENYLTDNEVTEALIQEAYQRTTKEINASHILVNLQRTAAPADTLVVFNKMKAIRNQVLNGADFAEVARTKSEGPSAESAGELGWFGGFMMVDDFENAAYKTPKGEVSAIFRTDFGYHILKVNDVRQAPGEVTVAHIMTYDQRNDSTGTAENRIKEIYAQLKSGKDFAGMAREFSEDVNSARNGGKMPRFGTGGLNTPAFEQAAFNLEEVNAYTEPVKTQYGWHIIQLLEKHPVPTFEESEAGLRERIKNSPRSRKITDSFTNKLITLYGVKIPKTDSYTKLFPEVTDSLMTGSWKKPEVSREKNLFVIKEKTYSTGDFYAFVINKQSKDYGKYGDLEGKLKEYYKEFVNESLINYYDQNLERDNTDFASIYTEYKEGLLLFDLMDKRIWEKAKNDTIGQMAFYDKNKDTYQWKRRLNIILTQNTTREIANQVKTMLESGKSTADIKAALNTTGPAQVMVSDGIVEENYARLPKDFELKKGISRVYDKEENGFYKVVEVKEVLEPSIKSFEEARGSVINDYQQELEQEWLGSLRDGKQIIVDQKVLQGIKNQINKRA